MKPGPTDGIQANSIKKYTFIVRSDTTCDVYNLDNNGQTIVTQNLITNVIEPVPGTTEVTIFENVNNRIDEKYYFKIGRSWSRYESLYYLKITLNRGNDK